jgi:hypothetical protein
MKAISALLLALTIIAGIGIIIILSVQPQPAAAESCVRITGSEPADEAQPSRAGLQPV